MSFGFEVFDSAGIKACGVGDRTGQVVTAITATATGGTQASPGTTTVNLASSFDSGGVATDSAILFLTAEERIHAFIEENASSPKFSVVFKNATTTQTVTVVIVHFGDT